jgi:hypothetical protein
MWQVLPNVSRPGHRNSWKQICRSGGSRIAAAEGFCLAKIEMVDQ